ncbi:hypothetical protein BXY41_103458 [Lacrimispora xylanisolvens]|uniref:Uncharacterized protein n=1 Tax=Lacrimispora xylanisolvens TaxID=384636 RepID=A0A2S6HWC3_9FIRM|nr:DUF5677 domain-containing protein [Hungatella xylanolytica]PPK82242.1 hypothetical protein BXY41_103458 [Hungatella xylanolytica]
MNERDVLIVDNMASAFKETSNKVIKFDAILNTESGKIIALYYSQLISKYNSICGLVSRGEYDSTYLIARHYLENYAILCELIKRFNTTDFENYFKRLIVQDMRQDKKIYREKDLNKYRIEKWKVYLNTYFGYELKNSQQKEIDQIGDQLFSEYDVIVFSDIVKRSLLDKRVKLNDETETDSKMVYPYLCSIAHVNFGITLMRSKDKNGMFNFNCSDENLEATVNTIISCYMDIAVLMENNLK